MKEKQVIEKFYRAKKKFSTSSNHIKIVPSSFLQGKTFYKHGFFIQATNLAFRICFFVSARGTKAIVGSIVHFHIV
jgi:hypothetical protein